MSLQNTGILEHCTVQWQKGLEIARYCLLHRAELYFAVVLGKLKSQCTWSLLFSEQCTDQSQKGELGWNQWIALMFPISLLHNCSRLHYCSIVPLILYISRQCSVEEGKAKGTVELSAAGGPVTLLLLLLPLLLLSLTHAQLCPAEFPFSPPFFFTRSCSLHWRFYHPTLSSGISPHLSNSIFNKKITFCLRHNSHYFATFFC